jgi:hypothetical protein
MTERSLGTQVLRRFFKHRLAVAAVVVLLLLVLLALGAPLSPYSPTAQDPANPFQSPSAAHWFGTDELGRDIFTRILFGGRVSLFVGLASTLLTIFFGVTVGAVSGYFGGWLDNVLMRITDTFLTFPTIFVLIILSSLLRELPVPWLKNSVLVVIVIIASLAWMWPARLVRSLVITLREREFVTAARALGGGDHPQTYPAQLHRSHPGQRHAADGLCHHHRIRAELPGFRRAAAHADLGRHPLHRSGARFPRPVDGDLPWGDDLHLGDDDQLHRRWAARCV